MRRTIQPGDTVTTYDGRKVWCRREPDAFAIEALDWPIDAGDRHVLVIAASDTWALCLVGSRVGWFRLAMLVRTLG